MPLATSHLPGAAPTPPRRHRDFRLLFIGRLVWYFGSMITVVAVPYQAYQLSHSVRVVGFLGLAELTALLVFAMLGSALADAADRRTLVLLSEAGLMAGSLVLAGNSLLTHPLIWLIFAGAALRGAFDARQRPSLDVLLPRLVDREELKAAAALGSRRGTVGMIAGPALAGVLIAVTGLHLRSPAFAGLRPGRRSDERGSEAGQLDRGFGCRDGIARPLGGRLRDTGGHGDQACDSAHDQAL